MAGTLFSNANAQDYSAQIDALQMKYQIKLENDQRFWRK